MYNGLSQVYLSNQKEEFISMHLVKKSGWKAFLSWLIQKDHPAL